MATDKQVWKKAGYKNLWYRDYRSERYFMYRQRPFKADSLGVMTEEQAIRIAAQLRENRNLGTGFQTFEEMQSAQDEEKKKTIIIEERERKDIIIQDFKDKNNTIHKYYTETYWPERQKRRGSSNQNRTVDGHFRNWISPIVGSVPFSEITYKDIDRIIQLIKEKGKTETTVKHIIDSFANIWNRALADDIISKPFPRKKSEQIRVDNEKTCFLSRQEADTLLETLKNWKPQTSLVHEKTLYGYCTLSLFSGLRCSEITSLTWQNIASGRVEKTKNGKARTVHFDLPEIAEMLDERKLMFPNRHIHDFVFPEQANNVAISKEFSRVVEELKFNYVDHRLDNSREKINFHALRHTFASWLAMEGTPLFDIMILLGHSSLRMVQRYAALSPEYTKKAVMALSKKRKEADFLAEENKRFISRNSEQATVQ